ncbi:uncharacterized protein LOC143027638 [Oratosquilla oratoria]|uniref:uncharacterized protein LOC143027638 n=1 Tax=Oratosquilla oratoria TaxID=337810 RepID=UPI003F75CEC2
MADKRRETGKAVPIFDALRCDAKHLAGPKMNWTKNDVITLLNSYKENECLWNTKNIDYSSREKKTIAYARVVDALEGKFNGKEIKAKWRCMKSQFVREIRKFSKNGDGVDDAAQKTSLWWFKQALFLKGFVNTARMSSTYDEDKQWKNSIEDEEEDPLDVEAEDENGSSEEYSTLHHRLPILTPRFDSMRKRSYEHEAFGASVAEELRSLKNPFCVAQAKFKIQQVLFEAKACDLDQRIEFKMCPMIFDQGGQPCPTSYRHSRSYPGPLSSVPCNHQPSPAPSPEAVVETQFSETG